MQDALCSLRDEREARMAVESLRKGLYGDMNRLKLEDKRLSDQVSRYKLMSFFNPLQRCNLHLILFPPYLFIVILKLRCFRTQIRR